jgi:hypothetical protein
LEWQNFTHLHQHEWQIYWAYFVIAVSKPRRFQTSGHLNYLRSHHIDLRKWLTSMNQCFLQV